MTAQQASPPSDGFELLPDGTVRLVIKQQTWRARRPTLGDYRKMRETLKKVEERRLHLMAEAATLPEKPPSEAASDLKLAYALEVSTRSHAFTDSMTETNVAWVAEALGALVDEPLPPADEWPSGMDSVETMTMLVQHWRSTPLLSGGS